MIEISEGTHDFVPVLESGYDWEIRYCGYRYDSGSRLYYVRYRYLDSYIGNWLSRDPIEYRRSEANLYAYVRNSPGTLLDPSGLHFIDDGSQPPSGPMPTVPRVYGPTGDPDGSGEWHPPASPEPGIDLAGAGLMIKNNQNCANLLKNIIDLQNEISKRVGEFNRNPNNLPWTCPGDNKEKYKSRRGHRILLQEYREALDRRINDYIRRCTKGPIDGPVTVPVSRDVPVPRKIDVPVSPEEFAVGVGIGYGIYRGVRLLPSLAPPLWWTLPANAAAP